MQLKTADFPFTLLTPCFSGTALGKLDDHAEMRVPPIRGHVRFWHRELFGAPDANHVWGSTSGNEGQGSRVALRFIGEVSEKHEPPPATLLPHKTNASQRGPRPALAKGEEFQLCLQRLTGCEEDDKHQDWSHAQHAVKLWLLLGCLGLRSNRAAGSVWPLGSCAPQDADALKTTLQTLGLKTWSVAIAGLSAGLPPDELRKTASDTIQNNPHGNIFGTIQPSRKPSPTKFKVIRLDDAHCLLAVAPHRSVHGHGGVPRTILREAEHLLLYVKPAPARWTSLGAWNHLLP